MPEKKEKQPETPPRKQNRMRIDAILNAIKKGEYDDKLADIKSAIEFRQSYKREELLEQVKEVYGEGYTIVPKNSSPAPLIPISSMGGLQGVDDGPITDDALGPDPVPMNTEETSGESPDIESRSPVIGPYNPS